MEQYFTNLNLAFPEIFGTFFPSFSPPFGGKIGRVFGRNTLTKYHGNLVGGFNPSEKYQSKWESSPNRGENKTYLKPPPRNDPSLTQRTIGKNWQVFIRSPPHRGHRMATYRQPSPKQTWVDRPPFDTRVNGGRDQLKGTRGVV